MRIHILGVCGTFMGGVARLAKQAGHEVTGSDTHVYPPMSTQLEDAGIVLSEGYQPEHLKPPPDQIVVGNVMSRGNPAVEYFLDQNLAYISGPQWLSEQILKDRWVLAVAGTHGKTTTASMLAWILEYAGLTPGFLIGGVPKNFEVSARLGDDPFFVIEADEYDTAFFDKRAKFVHYRPRTLILNNLEFDHADIFRDLADIQRQFHHLVRIVPGQGLIVVNGEDTPLKQTLAMGCWTPQESFTLHDGSGQWRVKLKAPDGSSFDVLEPGNDTAGTVNWSQMGRYNVLNALAAIGAARHAGVPVVQSIEALGHFKGVKRRLEKYAYKNGITLYDDFAHHPTAIELTLEALRARVGKARLVAILEPRSNTMKMGVHKDALSKSLSEADLVFLFQPDDIPWSLQEMVQPLGQKARMVDDMGELVSQVITELKPGDHVVIMSNGSFGGLHESLAKRLHSAA